MTANLAKLQARWDTFFPPSTPPPTAPVPPRKGGRQPDPNSDTSRILAKLNLNPQMSFDAAELHESMSIEKKKIERTLFKLYAAKKIAKAGRGRYKAKTVHIVATAAA